MPKKHFTEEEINKLSTNPYVKSVSLKSITYTDAFKRIFIIIFKTVTFFIKNIFNFVIFYNIRCHKKSPPN